MVGESVCMTKKMLTGWLILVSYLGASPGPVVPINLRKDTSMHSLVLPVIAALAVMPAMALAGPGSNAPWYPSLMAFEHYDSGRSHLFAQANFQGSFAQGGNVVSARVSPDDYLTPYNVVYLSADAMFGYG